EIFVLWVGLQAFIRGQCCILVLLQSKPSHCHAIASLWPVGLQLSTNFSVPQRQLCLSKCEICSRSIAPDGVIGPICLDGLVVELERLRILLLCEQCIPLIFELQRLLLCLFSGCSISGFSCRQR